MIPWLLLQIEIMRIKFMTMFAYRVVYFTGVFTYSINIGVYYFLWEAIYRHRSVIGGLSLEQMVTYVAIAWISRTFYFNNVDREIASEVRSGKVAVELARPYDYLTFKLSSAFGESVFRLLFFTLPGALFVYWLFPVSVPSSLLVFGYFSLSLILSFFVNNAINLLVGMTAFFTLNNHGVIRAKRIIVDLSSGLILPVSLFPPWVQSVFGYLPFPSISYVPTMIYTGGLQGPAMDWAIGQQFIWSVLLLALARFMFFRARRKMVVQGG